MVIQTFEKTYTVIKYICSDSNRERYLCREEDGQQDLVVCIKNKSWIEDVMEYCMRQRGNEYFSDFRACFISQEQLYIVMKYFQGISLREKLEKEPCSLEERLSVGKGILDQMLILHMPDYFLCDCLRWDRIILSPDLTVHFMYSLERLTEYGQCSYSQVQTCLASLFEQLFAEELKRKMLPPLARFCQGLRRGRYEDTPGIYEDYERMVRKVASMVSGEGIEPGTWGFRLWNRVRGYLAILRKLCAVMLMFCAVAFLFYAIWISRQDGRERETFEHIGTLEIRENREGQTRP